LPDEGGEEDAAEEFVVLAVKDIPEAPALHWFLACDDIMAFVVLGLLVVVVLA